MQEAHCSRRGRQRGAALRHWQRAFGDRVIVPPGTHTTDALFSLRVELEPGTLSCEGHFGVWPRLQAVSVDRAVVPPTSALELFWTLALGCKTDIPSCAAETTLLCYPASVVDASNTVKWIVVKCSCCPSVGQFTPH